MDANNHMAWTNSLVVSEHTVLTVSICCIPNWTPTQATVIACCYTLKWMESSNPVAHKGVVHYHLPVFWMANLRGQRSSSGRRINSLCWCLDKGLHSQSEGDIPLSLSEHSAVNTWHCCGERTIPLQWATSWNFRIACESARLLNHDLPHPTRSQTSTADQRDTREEKVGASLWPNKV